MITRTPSLHMQSMGTPRRLIVADCNTPDGSETTNPEESETITPTFDVLPLKNWDTPKSDVSMGNSPLPALQLSCNYPAYPSTSPSPLCSATFANKTAGETPELHTPFTNDPGSPAPESQTTPLECELDAVECPTKEELACSRNKCDASDSRPVSPAAESAVLQIDEVGGGNRDDRDGGEQLPVASPVAAESNDEATELFPGVVSEQRRETRGCSGGTNADQLESEQSNGNGDALSLQREVPPAGLLCEISPAVTPTQIIETEEERQRDEKRLTRSASRRLALSMSPGLLPPTSPGMSNGLHYVSSCSISVTGISRSLSVWDVRDNDQFITVLRSL